MNTADSLISSVTYDVESWMDGESFTGGFPLRNELESLAIEKSREQEFGLSLDIGATSSDSIDENYGFTGNLNTSTLQKSNTQIIQNHAKKSRRNNKNFKRTSVDSTLNTDEIYDDKKSGKKYKNSKRKSVDSNLNTDKICHGKKSGRKYKNGKRKSVNSIQITEESGKRISKRIKNDGNLKTKFWCKSKNCKRKFSCKPNYYTHLRTHYKIKAGICKKCDKGYASKRMLKLHKCFSNKNPEIDTPTFICKECGEMFYQRGTLQVHMQSHKSTDLYNCGLCTKVFILKSTMYKHILSHVSHFKCQTCSRIYSLPWQLDQHVLTHNENLNHHRCVYCGRIFLKQENFERHIKFHIKQNEKKVKKFTKVMKKKENSSYKKKKEDFSPQLQVKMPFKIKPKRKKYTRHAPKEGGREHLEDSPAIYYSSDTEMPDNTEEEDDEERFDGLHLNKPPFIHTFHCILCKLTFDNATTFERHVSSHKPGDSFENQETTNLFLDGELKNIFACQFCDRKFVNRKFAESHLTYFLDHKWDSNCFDEVHKQFVHDIDKCEGQLIDFDMYIYSFSVAHLKSIDATRAEQKTVLFHCAKCNTNFAGREQLFSHVKNCRKDIAKFWCPECSLKFETNKLLKDHIQLGHPKVLGKTEQNLVVFTTKKPDVATMDENNIIQCRRCDLTFSTTKEYAEHKKIHTAEVSNLDGKVINCMQCDAVLSCEAELYKHLAIHAKPIKAPSKNNEYKDKMVKDKDRWICKLCNKSYSSKCNLTRHITLHDKTEKKDHSCPFCSRIFKYHRYLQHHIMYMHKTKDVEHKCAECGAIFKTVNHLKRHMTLHTGEYLLKKKVSCSYCDKQFKCTEELNTHVRMHTGERPFGCEHCSYKASTFGNLNKHISRRHEKPSSEDRKKKKYSLKTDPCSKTNSSPEEKITKGEVMEIQHSEPDWSNSSEIEGTGEKDQNSKNSRKIGEMAQNTSIEDNAISFDNHVNFVGFQIHKQK